MMTRFNVFRGRRIVDPSLLFLRLFVLVALFASNAMGWTTPKLLAANEYTVKLTCDDADKLASVSAMVNGNQVLLWVGQQVLGQYSDGDKITFTASVKDDYKSQYLVKWNIGETTKEYINQYTYAVAANDANANKEIEIKLLVVEGMTMHVGVRSGVPSQAYSRVGVKTQYDTNINGKLQHKSTTVTFFADENVEGIFTGWYETEKSDDGSNPVSTEKEYTISPAKDMTLYADYKNPEGDKKTTITPSSQNASISKISDGQTFTFNVKGDGRGTVKLQKSSDNGVSWEDVSTATSVLPNPDLGGKFGIQTNLENREFPGDSQGDIPITVTFKNCSLADNTAKYRLLFMITKGNNYAGAAEVVDVEFANYINEEHTIYVDGNARKYWLYVPASVEGKKNVPVVFSLHGRGGDDKPTSGNKNDFTSLADAKGFIVVYPQGRNATDDKDAYSGNWYDGFGGYTGWEATGKENADTKFIQALAESIKNNSVGITGTTVDPSKFYLCGFSMGGMMTYACAKVLHGTFAAYGACGGFPLNEFHMNLATQNPVPFIHLHGYNDNMLGIKRLNTAMENLLFRNGCNLNGVSQKDWTTSTENGEEHHFKRYDFTGINNVPVTTVTFEGLTHEVEASAPNYLWKFFDDKKLGAYDSDIEWKWDMTTINEAIGKLAAGNTDAYTYGWHRIVNGTDRSLTYGDETNKTCTVDGCTSASSDCKGNHNVYHSIQLTAGTHTLYAKADVTKNDNDEGFVSIALKNNSTGAEIVARKLVNNTGNTNAAMNMLYEFQVGEYAEYSLVIKRSYTTSACTFLEIHRGSYHPTDVTDQSVDGSTTDITSGKLVELTFENGTDGVSLSPLTTTMPSSVGHYLKSRLDGSITDQTKYIVKDPTFGHYFQNIPDADIYDRYMAADYMRIVLGENNSLSGHDGIDGIQTTGQITIGFWVNGEMAVKRGLAYCQPSMFYVAGGTYSDPNEKYGSNPHMFNITCQGSLTGKLDGVSYSTAAGAFGDLCDVENSADFYKSNFYKDCNWHYITYQMYDKFSRYNMYVDGEPTALDQYVGDKQGELSEDNIKNLKSIVLGGANASNVTFAYDVAFAYDDIVIYNRVLSKNEINEIIKNKKYTPSVWKFVDGIASSSFFNAGKMDKSLWTYDSSSNTYTLNKDFTASAPLTYDGIAEIPAFKGLQFVTNGESKVVIDAKEGLLKLSQGVKVVFSNMVKDNYVRFEHKALAENTWESYANSNMSQIAGLPCNKDGWQRTSFKITDVGENIGNSVTMPTEIAISNIEATDKYFALIKFVDEDKTDNVVSSVTVTDPKNTNYKLPRLDLYINGVERLHKDSPETNHQFNYSSSSPHVATIDDAGNVTLKGVAGSTVITAELLNSEDRKYECDVYDKYAYEPSNRIFASYQIVVTPKGETSCKVEDNKDYQVGNTLYNKDRTIGVTLGGWTYNSGVYYDMAADSYGQKTTWEGQKYEKDDNHNYLTNSHTTEQGVFPEFFSNSKAGSFAVEGKNAAKSEQLLVSDESTYDESGNYAAPANNQSDANKTPWLLPCRGSHIKIEPTEAGLVSVYVMQEGCVTHGADGEPNDVKIRRVYVADEKGEIVKEVVADTQSKVAAQMWKDDGRARAEYTWDEKDLAYNENLYESFSKLTEWNDKWSFLDNWPNPGMQQHVFKLGDDKDGHVLITKGIVRYTFNVLPGKTYYIFSNTSHLGLAGFNFEKGKLAKYKEVEPDAKHDEWRATGDFETITAADVTLKDDEAYEPQTAKFAKVTLNRTFYKNYWNPICLPYSVNRRQIEKVFGDGTMVVLMKEIDTTSKTIKFVEHVNQDIIAGYPYLIFPTTKNDEAKSDHSEISGITTNATFENGPSTPLFTVGTDGNTYLGKAETQSDALVFKGLFENETMPVGSYAITKMGKLSRVTKEGLQMKPYRAYIHFNQTTAGSKALMLSSMDFSGFEKEDGTTTSIEDVLFDNGILSGTFDVYSISGVKVRSQAKNLYGLPKGIYIVNGKKYKN